jgi:diguanylate cyclase (GGDEF)-like protein
MAAQTQTQTRSRSDLQAFPSSPYAVELQRGAARRSFGAAVEAEYVRADLFDKRTLIRVACALAVLLAVFRGADQLLFGAAEPRQWILVAVVLTASLALATVAWAPVFDRWYLPLAQVVVPIRNALAAVGVAEAAANGQLEMLMILPLMVLGPFFFMGLRFRVALLAVAVTVAAFLVSVAIFGMALPVALRSILFLLLAAVACAIAARHLEKWSRTSFLESHLIEELAQHDTLTGLKNRRVFDEHLDRLWQRGIEESRAIAILMMDIDHFKAYNDGYGHQAGDQTLRRVAQTLQALVSRPHDVLARYGGEEFAVILYDIDGRQAEALAERMRRAIGDLAILHEGSPARASLTISVGVAVIEPSSDRKSRGALQLADQALYEAKLRGRNRVELMDQAAHRLLVTGVFSRATFARR